MSLMLNQGYGWAGDVNLRMIFDAYFSVERGSGYPAHRQAPQRASRMALWTGLGRDPPSRGPRSSPRCRTTSFMPALSYPGLPELLDVDSIPDAALQGGAREARMARAGAC